MIASAERARDCRKKPVWILGGAEAYCTDFHATINDPWFPSQGKAVRKATDRAFGLVRAKETALTILEPAPPPT